MELRHLRYFCEVAEHRSFTMAARKLNISQSGISGQVQDLEREIGVSLLRRNRREVSLTPEGTLFLEEAKAILLKADLAVDRVLRLSQGQTGRISIGLCGPVTAPILPRIVRAFRRGHPGVEVTITERPPADQVHALLEEEIDVGFTRSVPVELRTSIASELLVREPIVAALPKDHPLAKEEILWLESLASEHFVLYCREGAPSVFDSILSMCRRAKFSPKIVTTSSSWQAVLTMVESGEGVSLVPECVRQLRANDVVFRPIRGSKNLVDAFVIWRSTSSNVLVEQFLTLLRSRELPSPKGQSPHKHGRRRG